MYQDFKHCLTGVLFSIEIVILLIILHMPLSSVLVEILILALAVIVPVVVMVGLCMDACIRNVEQDHFRYNQARYLHGRYV
jgi:hypothetical protein